MIFNFKDFFFLFICNPERVKKKKKVAINTPHNTIIQPSTEFLGAKQTLPPHYKLSTSRTPPIILQDPAIFSR